MYKPWGIRDVRIKEQGEGKCDYRTGKVYSERRGEEGNTKDEMMGVEEILSVSLEGTGL